MFYQTQVSKLITGGIIDTNGRQLRFCGNLPVSEGDWVWTDGTVVFGHVPIRDTPNLQPIEGGIPAAFADDKGYFSRTGRFSKYSIAVDKTEPHWIVNGKRKYFHSADRVFDAEISIDENGVEDGLLTAELDSLYVIEGDALYVIEGDEVLNDDAIVIKQDGLEINRVYLHDYVHAIDKAQEIAARGAEFCTVEEFSGRSQLLNFQLHTDGSWDAIIASFAYAELRYEYKSYSEGRRAWKVVDIEPENWYYGKAYADRNYLVLFNSGDTFNDMVQKMRDKFAELGFDVKGDLYNAVAKTARGVGDVANIWHFGDRFVDIDPPDRTAGTERIICTYYLVHANSKGVTKILHEYADAKALKIYDDERYVFDEIHVPENANDIDFFWSVWRNDTDLPITHILGHTLAVIDPFGISNEIFETRVTYWHVYVNRPLLYEDDAIKIQNYESTWTYPLQDDYSCTMNLWRILNIFNPKEESIVVNLAQSSADTSRKIDLIIPSFRFVAEDYDTVRWFIANGYILPYIVIPAVTKLNTGYLIGIPQHGIYKVDKDGIAELISDKDELANLRLRYMPNLSKARR